MKEGCQTCKHNRKRTVREKTCLKGYRAVFGYGCKEYQRILKEETVMKKQYCESCGKLYNEAEYLVGQCNDCDPFEDPELLEELFGEVEYLLK